MKKFLQVLLLLILPLVLVGCETGQEGFVEEDNVNPDKILRILDTWERSGIGTHLNSGTDIGPLFKFGVEGLYQYIRSTDEIIPMLAEDLPEHSEDGLTTTITIRENAFWQNGDSFVAKDVWAFYYLNHTTITNYLLSVEYEGDKTVILNWNPNRVPVNAVKDLLIAQDTQGSVAFSEFRTYANEAFRIVSESEDISSNSTTWGAFNKFSKGELLVALTANLNAYRAHKSSWFVGTGAFQLEKESPTQLILAKNSLHWNAENIGFEKIYVYSSADNNQAFSLLSNNQIDYMDGLATVDTLEAILAQNKQLVHLKMYDPGSMGVLFNMEKEIWTDEVRLAFQYIFDREEVKNAGNPFAITSWYPMMGMAESEAQKWMSTEGFASLPKYSHNPQKAEELLIQANWTKQNNVWYDHNGKEINLTIGTVRDHPGQSQSALAIQAILTSFGIKSSIKMTDHGAFMANSQMKNSTYDLNVYWTDLNMSFSYPSGTYKFFEGVTSPILHVNTYPTDYEVTELAGRVNEMFDGRGSKFTDENGKVNFSTFVDNFYVHEGDDLKTLVDIYNHGFADKLWGIQMYQNVTGSFINASRILGVPLKDLWMENRNVTTVPEVNSKAFYDVARTNLIFGNGAIVVHGLYQPNATGFSNLVNTISIG
ncbi:ABC transporter substrate-binding protein [Acholeplasma laidlawii]|uniref:ABC transporter substrate-binding protein n=1 Tax=Acholeplasma laidlawii TaxID=2148 RepID=UPI0021F79179|nr:ABC transporter substrate-binding protein [Acholeplasma laidlawii]